MGQAKQRNRYPDVQEYLNRAADSERGIRVAVADKGAAFSLMMKMRAKQKDWRLNYLEIYGENLEEGHHYRDPLQLLSFSEQYDKDNDQWYVYIHKDNPLAAGIVLNVEEL